jgi:hypothetical protein
MENLTKKQAIVMSLESMNTKETERLISFIKEILYQPDKEAGYLEFKEHALQEIRDALSTGTPI